MKWEAARKEEEQKKVELEAGEGERVPSLCGFEFKAQFLSWEDLAKELTLWFFTSLHRENWNGWGAKQAGKAVAENKAV